MMALRKILQAYLETKHARVFFKRAPEGAQFPYLVMDFQPSFTPDEAREQLLIDIDGWDKPADGDSTALETLMETVNGDGDLESPSGLDRQAMSDEDIVALFRLEGRDPVDDEDPAILRRKYTYNTTIYFERSEE
jgi:hypothetical protein